MAIKELVQIGEDERDSKVTKLREPSEKVVDFGPALQETVDDLLDTLHAHDIAVGLAAPQIGVNKRICVVDLKTPDFGESQVLVNPEIVRSWGKKDKKQESCMSVPHVRGPVVRRQKVLVEYQDRHGNSCEREAKGFLARVFLHEIDHLNGLLYLDRMAASATLEAVDFFKS